MRTVQEAVEQRRAEIAEYERAKAERKQRARIAQQEREAQAETLFRVWVAEKYGLALGDEWTVYASETGRDPAQGANYYDVHIYDGDAAIVKLSSGGFQVTNGHGVSYYSTWKPAFVGNESPDWYGDLIDALVWIADQQAAQPVAFVVEAEA